MKRLFLALSIAAIAGSALAAGPVPAVDSGKRAFREGKVYCNDAVLKAPSRGENIACYNHDACYSFPGDRSRKDCDEGYLADMRLAGLGVMGYVKFKALRQWGQTSWDRCRDNDKYRSAKR